MRYALLILIIVVGLVALIWAMQRSLIYLPSRTPVPAAHEVVVGGRDVTLETSDGLELGAWFIPPRGDARDVAVLVANGNAGDRSLRAPLAEALADDGMAVLLFDYRGYGGNPGRPSEEGLARDVRAAFHFLTDVEGMPSRRLLYFGESLGAAVVTELATEHPPGGLLLRSPFSDLAAVGRVHYPFLPVGLLLKERYPTLERVRRIEVPTTVVYGSRDSIIPEQQSRAVAEAAAGPTVVVEIEANHNDRALLDGGELIRATAELADRIGEP